MVLPLYSSLRNDLVYQPLKVSIKGEKYSTTWHPGLVFDKFPDEWLKEKNWWGLKDDAKKSFFEKFIPIHYRKDLQKNLEHYLNRQKQMVHSVNGETIEVKTDWRFVSGLGCGHPYETGFIWHRTLGVPYLPGSSVKGMLRAYAQYWQEDESIRQKIVELFGPEEQSDQSGAGALIVFDALPKIPPKLELDILNPHYGEYYQDPENNPPADYLSPVPVFFLTVAADQEFIFSIAPRPGAYVDEEQEKMTDLADGKKLLEKSLKYIGIGAKTSVGYGIMRSENDIAEEKNRKVCKWLEKTIDKLKNDKDHKNQPEENLWKNPIAQEWLHLCLEKKPIALERIKAKWKELGISWINPKGKSAKRAKNTFLNKT
jgi:CRISPR-associated protein Cmr6